MLVERIGLPKSLISSSLEISMCEKPLRDFPISLSELIEANLRIIWSILYVELQSHAFC